MFERGELIDADLQRGNHVYIVAEGLACSFTQLADGRRQILRYFYPGDLTTTLHPASNRMRVGVRCLTRVKACRFEASLLRDALYARRDLLTLLTQMAAERLEEKDERMTDMGARTSEEALANFVLGHFRHLMGGADAGEIAFPVRLSDIADTIGITEVHAGRLMRKLESDRLVERRPSSRLFVQAEKLEKVVGR